MKRLLLAVVFAIGTLSIAYAQPKIGTQVPEVSIPDKAGVTQSLSSLKGKVVLVDFWASWCVPCRRSNKQLVAIYEQYGKKGFEIYGISLDEDKQAWQKAVAADKISWLQVNEPGGWNTPTAVAWNIEQLPSSFLVDKQGRVVSIDPTPAELEKYLKEALQ